MWFLVTIGTGIDLTNEEATCNDIREASVTTSHKILDSQQILVEKWKQVLVIQRRVYSMSLAFGNIW